MKTLIFAILFLCCINTSIAQENNYLFTNVSYTFFGTGDLQGSSVGIDYHRTIWKRFGLNVGFSRTSGSGKNNSIFSTPSLISNASFTGDSGFADGIAVYNTYILGATYKVSDGRNQVLFATFGLNYKNLKYNYIGITRFDNVDPSGVSQEISIRSYNFVSDKEMGLYGALNYHFYVTPTVSFGLHLAVENSPNMLSKLGLAVGYRF